MSWNTLDNGRSQLVAIRFMKYEKQSLPAKQVVNETRFNYGAPGNVAPEVVTQLNLEGKLYPIDFNGDGYTDFISERYTRNYTGKCVQFNQNRDTYEHLYEIWGYINQKDGTFTQTQIKQSFTSQIQVDCCDDRVKFLRIKTGDFDGDGKGDFMVHWAFNEMTYSKCKEIKENNWLTSAAFRCEFWTYSSGSFSNTILPAFDIGPSDYDRWKQSGSILFPEVFLADLDGNGLTDVFYDQNTLPEYDKGWTANWEWRFKLTEYDQNGTLRHTDHDLDFATLPDSIFIADFTGDGKVDLLTQHGALKRVHSLENRNGTPEIFPIFDYTFPHNIAGIGDFNADGKADLVTLPGLSCMPVGGLQNKETLQIHVNTGNGFLHQPSADLALNVAHVGTGRYDHLFCVDIDQDGYTDIIELTSAHVIELEECDCIENDPDINCGCCRSEQVPVTKLLHRFRPQTKSFTTAALPVSSTPVNAENYIWADFNANGAPELWIKNASTLAFTEFNANDNSKYLTQVSDGLARLTEISYDHLKLQNNSGSAFYSAAIGQFNYPYLPVNAPLTVAKEVTQPDGVGGTTTFQYSYRGLIAAHLQGVLGFQEVKAYNATTGILSIIESELVLSDDVVGLNSVVLTQNMFLPTRQLVKADIIISEQRTAYTIEATRSALGVPLGWRNFAHTTTAIDHLKETSIQTKLYDGLWEPRKELEVDGYGNILKSTTRWYNATTQTGTPVHTEITEATYVQPPQQPYPGVNMPAQVTVTNVRQGQPAAGIVRTTEYTYFNNGNLQKETFDIGEPEEYSLTYAYTHGGTAKDKGFLAKETQSAPGLPSRSTTYGYSTDYRFVTSATNPLGHTATSQYYGKTGWLRKQIDANGNETEYIYDELGNLIETRYPDGTTDYSGIAWTPANGPAGSLYYTWSQPHAGTKAYSYKDQLGREIRTEGEVQPGLISCQLTEYNAKGQVHRTSEPFANNQSPQHWVQYAYDDFGRQTTITHPNHVTQYTYTNRKTEVSRTTAGNPHIASQTHDARGLLTQSEDMGGTLTYTYYSDGKTKSVNTLSGTVTMSYNLHGQRTQLADLDAGTITSAYNAYGELTTTTDAEGNTYTFVYDDIGRMLERNGPEGMTLWTYDPTGNLGALSSVEGANGVIYGYAYDNLGRLRQETQTIQGQDYSFSYAYNADGRLSTLTYPNNLIVEHRYDATGNMHELGLSGAHSAQLIWNMEGMDAKGRLTEETYGNNITTQYGYDIADYGFLNTWQAGNLLNYSYSWEEQTGNLLSRHDQNRGLGEYFTYDDLDRLTSAQVTGQPALSLSYTPNNNGNIAYKSDAGQYVYNTQKPHAIEQLKAPVNPPAHNQYVNYTPFKKVADITEGDAQLYLHYGPDQQRQWAEYYMAGALEKTRIYTNGLYEEDRDANGEIIEKRSYIMAGGRPVAAFVQQGEDAGELQYLYTDYLGSLLLTTDENGNPLHEQNFDAWGNHRDPNTWQAQPGTPQPSLGDRGYTFHEHLPQFALINMNGRVYDPVLGRFLSPDPYVQAPTNTQNYNRYSYVLNNPLKYTDPSGEFIFTLAAALIPGGQVFLPIAISMDVGWITGGMMAQNNKEAFIDGAWRGLILGTLGGIAGMATVSGGLIGKVAFEAVKGGAIGAIGAGLYGSDVQQGFKNGMLIGASFALAFGLVEMARNSINNHGFRTNEGALKNYFKKGEYDKWLSYYSNKYLDPNFSADIRFHPGTESPFPDNRLGNTQMSGTNMHSDIYKGAFKNESIFREVVSHEWAHQYYSVVKVTQNAVSWNYSTNRFEFGNEVRLYRSAPLPEFNGDTPEAHLWQALNYPRLQIPGSIRKSNPYYSGVHFTKRFNFGWQFNISPF